MTDASNFPPGDEALVVTDDDPVDEAKAAAFRRQLDRAAGMSVTDAARMHIRAERKRLAAEHLEEAGDRIGGRLEAAEAAELEAVAGLAIDSLTHGPVVAGAGEAAFSKNEFADTLRAPTDMLAIAGAEARLELADAAGVLELALDTAQTLRAGNAAEKMLAAQLAAAHRLAMTLFGQAARLLERFEDTGHVAISIEAGRLATCASKLMLSFQGGLTAVAKLHGGGTQTIVVRQQVAVGEGGQAIVAGQVKARSKRRKREG